MPGGRDSRTRAPGAIHSRDDPKNPDPKDLNSHQASLPLELCSQLIALRGKTQSNSSPNAKLRFFSHKKRSCYCIAQILRETPASIAFSLVEYPLAQRAAMGVITLVTGCRDRA